jgi:hypothetical protein
MLKERRACAFGDLFCMKVSEESRRWTKLRDIPVKTSCLGLASFRIQATAFEVSWKHNAT